LSDVLALALAGALLYVLKDVIVDFLTGLILMMHPLLLPGDVIEAMGVRGRIKYIGIKWTVLVDEKGSEYLLDNSTLFREIIKKVKK